MERKDTVLISCASQKNRQYLRFALSERFHLLESANVRQMRSLLEQNGSCVATVVVGTSVVDQDGREALKDGWAEGLLRQVPVVILNEQSDPKQVTAALQSGAADVIDLQDDAYTIAHRVDTVTQLYLHRQHMESLLKERSDILRQSNDTMVDVLSSIIEYRSAESGHHVLRIRKFARILLEEVMHRCPEYRLTEASIDIISSASALHDVGKIGIPDAILTKPGPLTAEEWEIMKTHSAIGCRILENLDGVANQEYLKYAKNICMYHHERWDGSGYPEGLSGDRIPICAQVVGLADAYEALTGERSYKARYTFDQAINMILKGECGAFSPKLLACLKNCTEAYEALTVAYADGQEPEEPGADMSLPLPETNISSLERTQAMYYSLVHYINGFLMEVNLDQNLFHVIYNPYPEMTHLEGITRLDQMVKLMLDSIVVPQERERMQDLIQNEIPRFVGQDLRRSTHRFHYQELSDGSQGQFEMTLLRNSVHGSKRHSLAVLVRKVVDAPASGRYASAWYSLAESTYVCENDQDFTLVSLDRQSSGLGGYSYQELMTEFQGRLILLLHPDDREMVRSEFTRQLRLGTEVRLEHRVLLRSGNVMWVANKSRLAVDENGKELLHCFLTDITRTRTALEMQRQHLARYINVLAKTENVLFEWDVVDDYIDFSDTWEKVFHSPAPQGRVRSWLGGTSKLHPDDVPLLLDRIINLENGSDKETQELRVVTGQGRYVWCRMQGHAVRDERGRLVRVVGVVTSIEAEKQKEQILQDRAERDSLTKLLNKDAGKRRITAYLSHYPQGANCAMLIIDLDDFKNINDTYGHLFGDAVLSKVAHEIKRQFKGQDIVVRIGGDEFLVLARGLADRRVLEERCQRLIGSFCESLKAQHPELSISCSVGIALAPEDGRSYFDLFKHADQALYRAKAQGKNTYCFYDVGHAENYFRGKTTVSRRIDSDEEPGLAENGIVRHAFKLLYSAENVRSAINEVIGYLGKQMNVSRVYLFENSEDNRFCSNTFEWCNDGIEPQIDMLQNVSYEEDIPGYLECFDDQGLIYCTDIQELPKAVQDILEPQGIVSMLHCAIRPDGILRGYIGFDECVRRRLWTREEIQMLSYFTEVLATFLMKSRRQEMIASQAQDTMTILDNQDACIYIVDPETWKLRYVNKKAQGLLPQVKAGIPCYQCIQGRTSPCPDCPSLRMQGKKTARKIRSFGKEKQLLESTMIRWEGRDAFLMTNRVLPEE